jgi:hypothetical protein
VPPSGAPRRRAVQRPLVLTGALSVFMLVFVVAVATRLSVLAHGLVRQQISLPQPRPASPATTPVIEAATPVRDAPATFTFRGHELHPDRLYAAYLSDPVLQDGSYAAAPLVEPFRAFLGMYARRQAEDDNFTIRLMETTTGNTIEVVELTAERAAFRQNGVADWDAIDRVRRIRTEEALRRLDARGTRRSGISVRWGRADQVKEARERDAPYVMHEIALARGLGLSLLATEIGSVETFNNDRLISTVGARSRYQMMPDILASTGLRRYTLRTESGASVSVNDEWNPLFSMEPAFHLLRGYTNAVGHEMTGISAYHTGPGNVFAVYRAFLANGLKYYRPGAHVLDAYMWGLTEGFPELSANTSFKSYSRGYVASALGTLRANEDAPVDPSRTIRAELVQVKPGQQAALSAILDALSDHALDWSIPLGAPEGTLYQRFRRINPHFDLPGGLSPSPVSDVILTHQAGGDDVRFFLPIGAAEALRRAGLDVVTVLRRYDESVFAPRPSEETVWDRQYAALVARAERFTGFTRAAQAELDFLYERFNDLAAQNPTPYRIAQRNILRTHRMVWRTTGFERLLESISLAQGTQRMPTLPLDSVRVAIPPDQLTQRP